MVKLNRGIFAGFTLVETLISIAIFAIISGIIYIFFMVGIGSWEIGTVRTELQAQARIATDIMVGELKNTTRDGGKNPGRCISISPSSGNPPSDNTDITFFLPTDENDDGSIILNGVIEWPSSDAAYIKYEYLPTKKQIVRKQGIQQRILANDVSNIKFIDAGIVSSLYPDELNIILTLEKTTPRGKDLSFTMRSTVKLRN